MARLNVALAFVLATCFASTLAIYMECTMESYNKCLEPEGDVTDPMDPDDFCKPKMMVKQCLHSLEPSCSDGSNPSVQQKVADKLKSLNEELSDCPDDGPVVGTMMMASMNHHNDGSTRKPSSEPTPKPRVYNCSFMEYDMCAAPLTTLDEQAGGDPEMKCKILWKVSHCMEQIWMTCEPGDVRTKVDETGKTFADDIRKCEEHMETTKHPDHYHTTMEPFSDQCVQESFERCSTHMKKLTSMSDMASICYGYPKVKECFMAFVYDCKDDMHKNAAWESIKAIDNGMKYCPEHKETTMHPTSEPEPEHGGCTHEMYDKCTNPLGQLETNAYLTPEEQCRIWWNTKVCYAHMYHRCEPYSEVKGKLEGMWGYMESAMSFCNAIAGCTDEERKRCGVDVERAYGREEKCRAAGRAKDCLHEMMENCKDQFVLNQIHYESKPMIEKVMNDCMYGHGDGWEHDGYQGASSSSLPTALPILTLISALVAKAMFN